MNIPDCELEHAVLLIPDAWHILGYSENSVRDWLEIYPGSDLHEVADSRFHSWCWNLGLDPYDPEVTDAVIDYAIEKRKQNNEIARILRARIKKPKPS